VRVEIAPDLTHGAKSIPGFCIDACCQCLIDVHAVKSTPEKWAEVPGYPFGDQ
jgi:hypothetical protein